MRPRGASDDSLGKLTHSVEHFGEKLGQLAKLPRRHVANHRSRHSRGVRVQPLQEIESFSYDLDLDDSPILVASSPLHEPPGVETIDEPRDVRIAGDGSICDLSDGE